MLCNNSRDLLTFLDHSSHSKSVFLCFLSRSCCISFFFNISSTISLSSGSFFHNLINIASVFLISLSWFSISFLHCITCDSSSFKSKLVSFSTWFKSWNTAPIGPRYRELFFMMFLFLIKTS
eukprot:NODE_729_length_4743_cov_0.421619.p5 type:complete len:122 gc:universal NODE_729_length_4743_cov_0.421619:3386-3021(-)